jgi:hypothetical protein
MFQVIENTMLALYASVTSKLAGLKDERGQTSGEYTAVTAAGVLIAIVVIFGVLSGEISSAISTIGSELNSWVSGSFSSV